MVTLTLEGISEGAARAGAGNAAILINSAPFFVLVLERIFLRQRVSGLGLAGLVVGFAGIVVMVSSQLGDVADTGDFLLGMGLALAGAIGWAIGVLMTKILFTRHADIDMLGFTAAQFVIGGAVVVGLAFAIEGTGSTSWGSGDLWAAVVWLSLGASAIATLTFFGALKRLPGDDGHGLAVPRAGRRGHHGDRLRQHAERDRAGGHGPRYRGCSARQRGAAAVRAVRGKETGMEHVVTGTLNTFEQIEVGRHGSVAHIVLNRPEKRNALSLALMQEMISALEELGRDQDVRAIVVEGAGPAFSAGHDLAELVGRELAYYQDTFDTCVRMMNAIHVVPQPVIARVHGVATAAGCQLVAACDLAVAAESARFGTPGVKIGLFCSTPMVPISRAVGRKRAMEMLLTGELIDASTALDWGLVNRVVPDDELDAAVAELVERIARTSPLTVGIGKEAFYAQIDLDERQAYDVTKTVMAMNALAGDAQEGICAFLEKRDPTWTGA